MSSDNYARDEALGETFPDLAEVTDIRGELTRDLGEGLIDAQRGCVFSAEDIAADLAARRLSGE
jgi:hypothetical protein